jgi:hypothetical protein
MIKMTDDKLMEAKADRDRFKAWAGEELFNRFIKIKDKLERPFNDMTFWTSTRAPKSTKQLETIIEAEEEKVAEKETKEKLIKDGAKIIFEDDKWFVYSITTFEACQKYGAGTKWCITGKNTQ